MQNLKMNYQTQSLRTTSFLSSPTARVTHSQIPSTPGGLLLLCRDERGPTAMLNLFGVVQRLPFERAHAKHCTQNRIPWLMCCKTDPLSSLPAFWRYNLKCARLCGRANRGERVYLLTSQQSEGTSQLQIRTVSDRFIMHLHISTILVLICYLYKQLLSFPV